MTALSDLLSAHNDGARSARSIAREARERGHTLNHDTAARYLRGDHGKPDEATLIALADVLDIPLARLRDAAGLPSESTEPYLPPAEASRLTRRQRLAVDEIIRAMLDPRPATGDQLAERRTPSSRPASRRRAARHGDPET
jgi:transcriptional regulator with XRE-family HTH domain